VVCKLNSFLVLKAHFRRYSAHSRSIFDDLSLGGSLLPSRTKCCVRHPGSQCLHNLPAFFLRSLPPALSVYIPVHLLALLTRLPKLDLKTLVTDSARSATFLATCHPPPPPRPPLNSSSSNNKPPKLPVPLHPSPDLPPPPLSYCLGAQAGCCAYFSSKLLQTLRHPKIVYSGVAGALAGDARDAMAHDAMALHVADARRSGLALLVELPRRRTELSV
jgi:hypothetical protein